LSQIKVVIAIACGGAVGAVARYAVASGVYGVLGRGFPYGTLTVNVAGSFVMGLASVVMVERILVAPEWRAALLVGVLGAFTTFSAFSIETLGLIEQGDSLKAGANVVLSVALCVVACWAGLILGRQL
jgi:CrcB protein